MKFLKRLVAWLQIESGYEALLIFPCEMREEYIRRLGVNAYFGQANIFKKIEDKCTCGYVENAEWE